MVFNDRADAAERLSQKLQEYKDKKDVVVLAIPRGGLALGNVIARNLHAQLDVILAKKMPAPGQPEYAIGAVTLDSRVVNPYIPVDQEYIDHETKRLRAALKEKLKIYHEQKKAVDITDKIVILVDDGLATGYTMFAAIDYAKKQKPKKVIVALPVASTEGYHKLEQMVDNVVCLEITSDFSAVGQFYRDFRQVTDAEAIRLLQGVPS